MKTIFEKIIRDSVESIADGVLQELSSKKIIDSTENNIPNSEIKKEEIIDKTDTQNDLQKNNFEETTEEDFQQHEEVNEEEPKVIRHSDENEYDHFHKIGIMNAYSRNLRLNIMVACAAAGLVLCMLILTSYKGDLPGEVVGIISTVSGIFGACLKDAYSFEFGSSRGSKDKDEKISATILSRLKR